MVENIQGILDGLSLKERKDFANRLEKLALESSLSRFLDRELDPIQGLYLLLSEARCIDHRFQMDTYIALHGYLRSKVPSSGE
jgi:hypothetical protein